MAFKMEKMTEADIAYYNSFEFKNVAFGSIKYDPPLLPPPRNFVVEEGVGISTTAWIVDKERNAFVRGVGGGGHGMPEFQVLVWNGDVIICSFYEKYTKNLKEFNFWWIQAPKHLQSEENSKEIINMIKEALILEGTGISIPAGALNDQDYAWLYSIEFNNEKPLTGLVSTKELKKDDPEIKSKIKQVLEKCINNPDVPQDLLETQNYSLKPKKFTFNEMGVGFRLNPQDYKNNYMLRD